MRKRLIGLLILSGIAVQAPQPAEAGAFATEVTQVLNHAQLAMTYIRQGLQLQNEIKMYTDMIRNVKQLPNQTFGPITADLNALAAIVQGGQVLAYSLGNLDVQFRNTFRGYGATPNTYYVQYRNCRRRRSTRLLGVSALRDYRASNSSVSRQS